MRTLLLVALCGLALATETWKALDADRTIDVTSQIVKTTTLYTFENVGSDGKSVDIALSSDEDEHRSFISAQIDGVKGRLKVSKKKEKSKDGFQLYSVELRDAVEKGKQVKIRVNTRLTHVLTPLPAKIAQEESQFVVYAGSAYVPSAYAVVKQKTLIKTTPTSKILSSTAVDPHKQETEKISYGPYNNIAAYELKPIKVHYENNSPFVVAALIERTIEISHWGNIAVEEYIELVHKGAELKTVLPATARDIYYRDEIGNISTSAVRVRADSVDVEIRPRFPLFGGWRTSYVLGYNLPTHEYLHSQGNQYMLKIRVLDHVFENIVVEKLVTKVILPEHVRKVKLVTPFAMERRPDEIKPTYLDTTGRYVVIVAKEDLVPDHIQSLSLTYEFEFKDMLREPLLATAFFFTFFLAIIIYVRFDFTIAPDTALEAREKLEGRLREIAGAVQKKQSLYAKILDAANTFKHSRDTSVFGETKKAFEAERGIVNEKLSGLFGSIKNDKAAFEKAQDLLKYDDQLVGGIDAFFKTVEKSQQKSAGAEEVAFTKKIEDARHRADHILASL